MHEKLSLHLIKTDLYALVGTGIMGMIDRGFSQHLRTVCFYGDDCGTWNFKKSNLVFHINRFCLRQEAAAEREPPSDQRRRRTKGEKLLKLLDFLEATKMLYWLDTNQLFCSGTYTVYTVGCFLAFVE